MGVLEDSAIFLLDWFADTWKRNISNIVKPGFDKFGVLAMDYFAKESHRNKLFLFVEPHQKPN